MKNSLKKKNLSNNTTHVNIFLAEIIKIIFKNLRCVLAFIIYRIKGGRFTLDDCLPGVYD